MLSFLLWPSRKGATPDRIPWVDLALAALSLGCIGYMFVNYDYVVNRFPKADSLSRTDMAVGIVATLLVLEATRRTIGAALPIVAIVFLLYAFAGPWLYGWTYHKGLTLEIAIDQTYFTTEGIFGVPMTVAATYVILFIIFGSFLERSGAGEFFMNFANAIAGGARGGPGKGSPFFTEDNFSYNIDVPRQEVNHHLAQYNTKYFIDESSNIHLDIGIQINKRSEFDIRRSNRNELPALDLLLFSQYYDLYYFKQSKHIEYTAGIQYRNTNNTNVPGTGILPLIPDYINNTGAGYLISKYNIHQTQIESGLRIEFRNYFVARIDNNREIIKEHINYLNWAANIGVKKSVTKDIKMVVDISYTNRPPDINELFSNGLHQGVSGIEEGNAGGMEKVTAITETFIKERQHNLTDKKQEVTIDDACAFLAKFDNGALSTFESTRYARGRNNQDTFEVNGEHGSIYFDLEDPHQLQFFDNKHESHIHGWQTILVTDFEHPYMDKYWVPGTTIDYEHTFVNATADFLKSLEAGQEAVRPNFRDALETQYVCDAVLKSGITAIAYETIKDSKGTLPLLTPMSEVAGRMTIQEGAKCLERPFDGRGILLAGVPGVPPATVTGIR